MKTVLQVFALIAFMFTCSGTVASFNTKTINITVTQGTYAELTGTAADGNIKKVSMDNITANSKVSLGTLGVNSNGSSCSIAFSTLNNYSLKHETTGGQLKRYSLNYLGSNISNNANAKVDLNSCVMAPTALNFVSSGNMPATIEDGIYKDIMTITLTAE